MGCNYLPLPLNTVGCNYLSLPLIYAYGTHVLNWPCYKETALYQFQRKNNEYRVIKLFHQLYLAHNSDLNRNLFKYNLISSNVIAPFFCTWHHSIAAASYAKICSYHFIGIYQNLDQSIWIMSEKATVNWAQGCMGMNVVWALMRLNENYVYVHLYK